MIWIAFAELDGPGQEINADGDWVADGISPGPLSVEDSLLRGELAKEVINRLLFLARGLHTLLLLLKVKEEVTELVGRLAVSLCGLRIIRHTVHCPRKISVQKLVQLGEVGQLHGEEGMKPGQKQRERREGREWRVNLSGLGLVQRLQFNTRGKLGEREGVNEVFESAREEKG